MNSNPDIEMQRTYYNDRWSQEQYANLLQLRRSAMILDGLWRQRLNRPKVLDLGCGTGWLAGILSHFGPTTGMDLSTSAIQIAQNRYPDIRFIVRDFSESQSESQIEDGSFDIVVSQEVIEHVEDQAAYLDLSARFLKANGYLILTTPNAWNLAHWTQATKEKWGLQPIEKWLTTKQLHSLLEKRFKVIELCTFIAGYGTEGICGMVNSAKLMRILEGLRMRNAYENMLERAGFGLHLFALARRR